jgi:hypothetical protein
MATGLNPAAVERAATPFEELLPALARLDRRLARAVDRARATFGAEAAGDGFRGLYITDEEVDRLIRREPGGGAFSLDDDLDLGCYELEPRLSRVAALFELTPFDVAVLLIALAPSLDLRYERIFAYLQDDVSRRRPSVDLALTLLCESPADRAAHRARFAPDAPLQRHRVVRVTGGACSPDASLLSATLEVSEQLVGFLLGHVVLDRRLTECCTLLSADACAARAIGTTVLETDQLLMLEHALLDATFSCAPLRVHLRGREGAGKRTTAMALAASTQSAALAVHVDALLDGNEPLTLIDLALQHARLHGSTVLVHDATRLSTALRDRLARHDGIVVLCSAGAGPADDLHDAIVVALGHPPVERRRSLWRDVLARAQVTTSEATISTLAERFRLTPGQIVAAVSAAAAARRWSHEHASNNDSPLVATLGADALFAAARAQCGHTLASLARRTPARRRWEELVLPDDSRRQLREMCGRVASRERVLDDWGFASRLSAGGGLNALFSGPSGTGKTLAAEVMAGELGVDLFRVDLAGIVSKYIGETEKNLDRVFTAAEDANGVLFFDEADSLFGKRSEVRDSHDRYANIEVSYMLQKMEQFDGIAILATNLRANLDQAFVRRLSFMVHFPLPDLASRRLIWTTVWPERVPLRDDVDLDFLASQFALSGGNIRNIAVAAAFNAASRNSSVAMCDLIAATRREYQKLGKELTAAELGPFAELA